MQIIDGKKIAAEVRGELKERIIQLKKKGIEPGLATILVGDDPASHSYVASKIKMCGELGIHSFHHKLEASATEEEIVALIQKLNNDLRVNGILLQLPLPKGTPAERALDTIAPHKDVDGLHPYNLGQVCIAKSWDEIEKRKLLTSCTPTGVILLLKKAGVEIAGKKAVVLGRSNLVGKPVAMLLLANNATVTMAHSMTKDLPEVCRQADILVSAMGKPRFVTKDFIKPGAVVIDVGTTRLETGLCGDVDFDAVKDIAGAITPVPGGVGPMTIAMLMRNTVLAAEREDA
jgi:methylenetetrahydrofolate dehydrogenase (NADP+)/methenyltetrahydrofolate cyclohydrolase